MRLMRGIWSVTYTVPPGWGRRRAALALRKHLYSLMPQVVAAWCRRLGHRVHYATYYGQADPARLLPDDLDVVFLSAATQASGLAYALARRYRRGGTRTVLGGPHAKCFPADALRFFDIVVPSLRHSLGSGLVTVAALSIGEFQLSNLVAGFLTRPYPVVLLQAFYGATGFACAATTILLALALLGSVTGSLTARGTSTASA